MSNWTRGLSVIFVKLISWTAFLFKSFWQKACQFVNELQWNVTAPKWPRCTCRACVSWFPKSSRFYLSLPGEEASVFKCSVSRETECSRVGKQSFIITLGCNSVLLQFSSPAGMSHTSAPWECNTPHRGDTEVATCMRQFCFSAECCRSQGKRNLLDIWPATRSLSSKATQKY